MSDPLRSEGHRRAALDHARRAQAPRSDAAGAARRDPRLHPALAAGADRQQRQTWRWLVVTDAGKRAELARIYREGGDQYLEMARTQRAGRRRPDAARLRLGVLAARTTWHEVPVHVIPCVVGRPPAGAPVGDARLGVRLDLPGGVELPARAALARARLGADHAAPVPRAGGGEAARHSRRTSCRWRSCRSPTRRAPTSSSAQRPAPETITSFDSWSLLSPWARSRCTPSATRTASR